MVDAGDENHIVDALAVQIDSWLEAIPRAEPSAVGWFRTLLSERQPTARLALGLNVSTSEARTAIGALQSDSPLFHHFKYQLNQQVQIYLGGVETLSHEVELPAQVARHLGMIRDVRGMLGRQPIMQQRVPRTLASVTTAIRSGSLRIFRTGDVDSDLWVVLKTIHENWNFASPESIKALVDYVARIVSLELQHPRSQIADQRHAWWAVRTLYEATARKFYPPLDEDLAVFLRLLLDAGIYDEDVESRAQRRGDETHSRETMAWQLINISQLKLGWSTFIDHATLERLNERESVLIEDVRRQHTLTDLRLATVYLRAEILYRDSAALSRGAPTERGRTFLDIPPRGG